MVIDVPVRGKIEILVNFQIGNDRNPKIVGLKKKKMAEGLIKNILNYHSFIMYRLSAMVHSIHLPQNEPHSCSLTAPKSSAISDLASECFY